MKSDQLSKPKLAPIASQRAKFSNLVLFERREKEFIANQKKDKKLEKLNTFYLTEKPFETTTVPSTMGTEPSCDVNMLKAFEANASKADKEEKDKKSKTVIDFKTKALNRRKESVKDFINKTRELILMKYTHTIKQERAIRLKETYENEIESINDTIKSLKQAKTLFNDTFYVKFGEYVKRLSNQKEIEKSKSAGLLEEIIKYKNEISQIESKIRKIEQDKANVIRWLYFQIQLKEKLLTLPISYKKIIEESNEENNTIPDVTSTVATTIERVLKKRNTRRITTIRSMVSTDEADRIKHYKSELIFKTPEEFLAQLKKYENDNINLINAYNELSTELRELHKEHKELLKVTEAQNLMESNEIESKEKELRALIERNNSLKAEMKTISIDELSLRPLKSKRKDSVLLNKVFTKAKLFSKILNLYKATLEIESKKTPNDNKLFIKKVGNTEEEMLLMLKHTEISVDRLFGIFKDYNKNKSVYHDLLKKIKNTIEKEHKIEKAKRQRDEQLMKLNKLKEQIEERNNKIYIKPTRKIDNYYQYVMKKHKKDVNDDDQFKEPLFVDFMYDIMDEDKKEY